MTEHRERLDGLDPALIDAADRILRAMAAFGHPMFVAEGVRSQERQALLYAQGRTLPGAIVTNVDGVTVVGAHQTGRAMDLAFQDPHPWDDRHPWAVYGALVEACGLVWGGRFRSLHDCPHAELRG